MVSSCPLPSRSRRLSRIVQDPAMQYNSPSPPPHPHPPFRLFLDNTTDLFALCLFSPYPPRSLFPASLFSLLRCTRGLSPDGPPRFPGTHPSAPTHCPFFGPPVTDCSPASPCPVAGQTLQPGVSAVTLLAALSLALPGRALHVSSHGLCEFRQRCCSPESILR